jgi:hypothetical protein
VEFTDFLPSVALKRNQSSIEIRVRNPWIRLASGFILEGFINLDIPTTP